MTKRTEHLFSHFQTKDLRKLEDFLVIDVSPSKNGKIISIGHTINKLQLGLFANSCNVVIRIDEH